MEHKGCEKVINQVSAIIDGETSVMARARFKAHMMICPSCRRYFKQFKAVKEASGIVTERDLPKDFEAVMRPVLDLIGKELAEEG